MSSISARLNSLIPLAKMILSISLNEGVSQNSSSRKKRKEKSEWCPPDDFFANGNAVGQAERGVGARETTTGTN